VVVLTGIIPQDRKFTKWLSGQAGFSPEAAGAV
jgi:hypothetical protein